MYEDELIPLFEKCGSIWDLRLMMDPMTGQNRGYAFVTFTSKDAAQNAVREVILNMYNIFGYFKLLNIKNMYYNYHAHAHLKFQLVQKQIQLCLIHVG